MEWYDGNYAVLPDVNELSQRPHIGRGDIVKHKSGAIILRCPACGAVQFARAQILNSDKAPTLSQPVHCGSGHCQKCAIWFTIKNGRAEKTKEPKPAKVELSNKLKAAGVGPARVEKDPKVKPRFKLKDLNR